MRCRWEGNTLYNLSGPSIDYVADYPLWPFNTINLSY